MRTRNKSLQTFSITPLSPGNPNVLENSGDDGALKYVGDKMIQLFETRDRVGRT